MLSVVTRPLCGAGALTLAWRAPMMRAAFSAVTASTSSKPLAE
jgi:hypothetical protein